VSLHSVAPIDVFHCGYPRTVGAYAVSTEDGPALVDCGPAVTIDALRAGLADNGLSVTDLRHLLVTHVHLDHAGAAGALVRENPALQVHVAESAIVHLAYPVALEHSARRIYRERFDELWGELVPVPEKNLHAVGGEVAGIECFATPGHASHHVSYLAPDGTLYAGDVAGVRILPGAYVSPPTPPPDIDLAAWFNSIEEIERRRPRRLALTHFGVADDPAEHLTRLWQRLVTWSELVRSGADEADFVAVIGAEIAQHPEQQDYHKVLGLVELYRGLKLYIDRSAAGSLAS
jgi:glyoxylase-like metal-dependent hydrolase (beta-lactamase superfamily II)